MKKLNLVHMVLFLFLLALNSAFADELISLNKPATSSSNYGPDYKPMVATDGIIELNQYYTWWASAYGSGEYIDVDLQAVKNISRIKLYLGKPLGQDPSAATVAKSFVLEAFQNNQWMNIATVTNNTLRDREFSFQNVEASKIRFKCTYADFCRIRELEIYANTEIPNVLPTASAGVDKEITLPSNLLVLNGSGTDSDGTIVSYAWSKVSGPSAALANANTANLSLSNLVEGLYVFRLTVTDNRAGTASDDITVVVKPEPVVAVEQLVSLNKPVTASSVYGAQYLPSVATDGVIELNQYYTWWASAYGTGEYIDVDLQAVKNISRIKVYLGKPLGQDPSATTVSKNFVLEAFNNNQWVNIATATNNTIRDREFLFQNVQASKIRFKCTTAEFCRIRELEVYALEGDVTPVPNVAPIANAGADRTITLPTNSLVINGSASDSDGTIASYAWIKVSGGSATLANANTANLSLSNLVQGSYVFRLTVTDNKAAVASDDVSVVVNAAPNVAPVANAGADRSITLPTNSIVINGSASDADGSIASYAWIKVSGSTATLANANTANLSLSALVQGSYVFRLTVVDNSGASSSDDVSVTVNPVVTNPTFPDGVIADFQAGHFNSPSGKSIDYRFWVPDNYDPAVKYPIFIFLHGAGENSWSVDAADHNIKNLEKGFFAHGPNVFVSGANRSKHPTFVLVPQFGIYSEDDNSIITMEAIEDFMIDYNIDPDRIYVSGLSQGGGLTHNMMVKHYNKLAAAAPMSGWMSSNTIGYQNMATWLFHAENDTKVGINGSIAVFDRMNSNGGKPIFTRYATGGHSSTVWKASYNNPYFVDWMMKQRRGQRPIDVPVNCNITEPQLVDNKATVYMTAVTVVGNASLNAAYTTNPGLTNPIWFNDRIYGTTGSPQSPAVGAGTTAFTAQPQIFSYANNITIMCRGATHSSIGGTTWYPTAGGRFLLDKR
ncbi:MAG: discoidin domain-containing protein [Bacteriovoracaceae bacterium]|nr:discoidin domain-containing protein [Bacteriovoracaceae bacterium]